jgi:hypothetical protein
MDYASGSEAPEAGVYEEINILRHADRASLSA